jgi:hypothetical protein
LEASLFKKNRFNNGGVGEDNNNNGYSDGIIEGQKSLLSFFLSFFFILSRPVSRDE